MFSYFNKKVYWYIHACLKSNKLLFKRYFLQTQLGIEKENQEFRTHIFDGKGVNKLVSRFLQIFIKYLLLYSIFLGKNLSFIFTLKSKTTWKSNSFHTLYTFFYKTKTMKKSYKHTGSFSPSKIATKLPPTFSTTSKKTPTRWRRPTGPSSASVPRCPTPSLF